MYGQNLSKKPPQFDDDVDSWMQKRQQAPSVDDDVDSWMEKRSGVPAQPKKVNVGYYGKPTLADDKSPANKPMIWQGTDTDPLGKDSGAGMTIFKPHGAAPKPRAVDPRSQQAAKIARKIEEEKQKAVRLFQQADRAPLERIGGAFDNRQQLRAQAEGKLEQANMLAKNAQRDFGDELEIGFGKDADPTSTRQWAYAKPRSAKTKEEHDAQAIKAGDVQRFADPRGMQAALNVTPEDKQRFDRQRAREKFEQLNPVQRMATRAMAGLGGASAADIGDVMAPVGQLESSVNEFVSPAIRGAAGIPEGLARFADRNLNRGDLAIAQNLQTMLAAHPEWTPEEKADIQARINQIYANQSAIGDRFQGLSQAGERLAGTVAPTDPNAEASINPLNPSFYTTTLPRAAGSMAPFMAAGAAGGAAGVPTRLMAAVTGVGMSVPEQYREAKKLGATPEQLAQAVDTGTLQGLIESLGAQSLMGGIARRGVAPRVLAESARESGQEALQSVVGDVGAKYYSGVKPNLTAQQMAENALQQAVPAAFLGAGGGIGSNAVNRQQGANIQRERPAPMGLQPTILGPTQITRLPQVTQTAAAAQSAGLPAQATPAIEPLTDIAPLLTEPSPAIAAESQPSAFDRSQFPPGETGDLMHYVASLQAANAEPISPDVSASRELAPAVSEKGQTAPLPAEQTATGALRAEADAAKIKAAEFEQAGDFAQAAATHQTTHNNLKLLRRKLGVPKTAEDVARINQIDREVSIAATNMQKAKVQARQMAKQANAPTAGLPSNEKAKSYAPPQPVDSAPLLRPEAVQNPEVSKSFDQIAAEVEAVPVVEEKTGNTVDFTPKTPARPSRRKMTTDLSPVEYLKRKTNRQGFRVSDKGEARRLGSKEAGIIGLTNKQSKWSVRDAQVMLDEGGFTMPDGRAFTDDSVTENDVLRYLDDFGKQKPMNTGEINRRLVEEEAAYNASQEDRPTISLDEIAAEVEAEFKPDTADLREVREFGRKQAEPESFTEEPPTAPLARPKEQPSVRDILRGKKGEFGKLSAFTRQGEGLSANPDLRRMLGLKPMPAYHLPNADINQKTGKPFTNPEWSKAAQETMDALSDLAGIPRSSRMGIDGLRKAYGALQKKGKIGEELKSAFVDAADKYTNFVERVQALLDEDSAIAGVLDEVQSTYEQGKELTAEQSRRLAAAVESAAEQYNINGNYARKTLWPAIRDTKAEYSTEGTRVTPAQPESDVRRERAAKPRSDQGNVAAESVETEPSAPKVKEPWEMTREEWLDYKSKAGAGKDNFEDWMKEVDKLPYHSREVRRAIVEGKPVPAEVLADYPNLLKKPEPAPIKTGDSVTWQRGDKTESGKVTKIVGQYVTATAADGETITRDKSKFTTAPRIAERRASVAPFTGRYTVKDLAKNATAEYRPARNRPGTIYLNDWGHALLADTIVQVYGEKHSGVSGDLTISANTARNLADEMRGRASGEFASIAKTLETAADDADANGRDMAIVTHRPGQAISRTKTNVRHETTHAAQSAIDEAVTGAATDLWLDRQPKAKQIREALTARGYTSDTHGYEAVAFTASGEFDALGLSLNEAEGLLDSYYRATVQKYGASVLEKFGAIDPKLQPTLEGAKDEAGTRRTVAEERTEDAGRSDRSATEFRSAARRERQEGADSSAQEREKRAARLSEKRSSFGALASEPTGEVLGAGLGGLQKMLGRTPKVETPEAVPNDWDVNKFIAKIGKQILPQKAKDGTTKPPAMKLTGEQSKEVMAGIKRMMAGAKNEDFVEIFKAREDVRKAMFPELKRDVKWFDHLQSRLSNVNFKGTYEKIAGKEGKEISEIFRNAQVDAANNKITRGQAVVRLNKELKPYIQRLKLGGKPGLARWVETHIDAISDPDASFKGLAGFLKSFQYNTKLRLNPRSTFVNSLQPLQTLWPHLTHREYTKVWLDAFKKENRDRVVELAKRESGGGTENVNDEKRRLEWLDLFSLVSVHNRVVGHLAGELLADKKGLTGDAKARMAADWAKKVEFDNSVYDIPPLFSGKIAGVVGQFKPFMVKNLERIYSDWKSAPAEAIATNSWSGAGKIARRSKMVAAQLAIGGVRSAVPGIKMIGGVLLLGALAKGFGAFMDDDKAEKMAEAVYFGAPGLLDQDLSGSVMIFDEPFGQTTEEKIVNMLGPTISLAVKAWKEGGKIYNAEDTKESTKTEKREAAGLKLAKAVTPYTKSAQAIYAATQGKTPDVWLGKKEPMTVKEAIGYGLMGTPLRQSKYYEHKETPAIIKGVMPDRFPAAAAESKKTRVTETGEVETSTPKQRKGEPEAIYKQRVQRVEGWMDTYGEKLISHPRYKALPEAEQKQAIESLRRRIGRQQNLKRPNERGFEPAAVLLGVKKAARERPKREARQLYTPQP